MLNKRQKYLLKRNLKNFSKAFVIVAVTFGLIELILRIVDPWGIAYFNDITKIGQAYEYDDQRLAVLPDGVYRFSNWRATMQDDLRLTPATSTEADCTIVFLGDSVTFGYGVRDQHVWVNLLAEEFPDVELQNTGIALYAIDNIVGTYEAFPDADAYIYLVTNNDADPLVDIRTAVFINPARNMPYLVNYPSFYLNYRAPSNLRRSDVATPVVEGTEAERYTAFLESLERLTANGDVTVAGFESDVLNQVAIDAGFDVTLLPPYPSQYRISFADVHLNRRGNQELASYMRPIVAEVIDNKCN